MKIYIAGPMTGLPDFNYPAFNAAQGRLEALGFDVLNPTLGEPAPPADDPKPWDWYMRRALGQVITADAVALLPYWEQSRGARLEHAVAWGLGLPIRPLLQWLTRGEAA